MTTMIDARPAAARIIVGTLITMNPAQPRAEAMALLGERIVAVGSLAECQALLPTAPVERPLFGCILPGFIDSHVHMLIAGIELQRLDLDGVRSVAEVLERIREHLLRDRSEGWLVAAANFQCDELAEGRLPTRAELDAVCPHRPLLLDQRTHDAIVNSAALALAGIDRHTQDPDGGHIGRDTDGEPNGLLVERPAADLCYRRVPRTDAAGLRSALRDIQPEFHRLGITTIAEPGLTPDELAAYAQLHAEGGLTMRCVVMPLIDGSTPMHQELARIHGLGIRTGFGDAQLRYGGLKAYFDGTGSFGTALLREPWPGSEDYCGTQIMPSEDFLALVRYCAQQRWSLAVHAVGGGALDRILEIFTSVHTEHALDDLRFSLLHAYLFPSAENLQQAARLGVVAAVQPGMHWRLGAGLKQRFGTQAADTAPWRAWRDAGVVVAGGSDGPDFPLSPVFGMWTACTRKVKGLDEPLGAQQALSLQEALESFTTQAAYACFCEHERGALKPGFLADWVGLSADPFTLPVDALQSLEVLHTEVGGRCVFSRLHACPITPFGPAPLTDPGMKLA